jgi:hypothetical protein
MKNSSLWHHRMRQTTKTDPESPFYGLMPRGMGDGGLSNDGDYFGIFYPHNCYAVLADRLTLEAAETLGITADVGLLAEIYETAADLVTSLQRGAVKEPGGYRRIPGMAGKRSGNSFGSLYAFHPARLLSGDDPLIQGTLRFMERRKSPGGQPMGTGWMPDGIWACISLDDLAGTYLAMGDGDKASQYLYSAVNHASRFLYLVRGAGGGAWLYRD